MIKNIPINMIFTVFWKFDKEDYAYMNVLYKLTFIERINVDMKKYDSQNTLKDLLSEEANIVDISKKKDLVLSAQGTELASK